MRNTIGDTVADNIRNTLTDTIYHNASQKKIQSLVYHTQFDQMKKSDVNGENALPLFKYLKSQQGFKGFTGPMAIMMGAMLRKIDKDYKNNPEIKWNFTKFLVDREGNVVARYEPTTKMKDVEKAVTDLL